MHLPYQIASRLSTLLAVPRAAGRNQCPPLALRTSGPRLVPRFMDQTPQPRPSAAASPRLQEHQQPHKWASLTLVRNSLNCHPLCVCSPWTYTKALATIKRSLLSYGLGMPVWQVQPLPRFRNALLTLQTLAPDKMDTCQPCQHPQNRGANGLLCTIAQTKGFA